MNTPMFNDEITAILDKHKPELDHYGVLKIDGTVNGSNDSGEVFELDILFEFEKLNKAISDERKEHALNILKSQIVSMLFEMTYFIHPDWNCHVFSIDVVNRTINVTSATLKLK